MVSSPKPQRHCGDFLFSNFSDKQKKRFCNPSKGEYVMLKPFRERLQKDVLVCDGATGTMLYVKGIYVNRCFEGLNLSSPQIVNEVHREYVKAGADIIETNTYGANRYRLGPHGLESQLEKINITGAEIAREAAGEAPVYIAGSIGPLGQTIEPLGRIPRDEARESFCQQAAALQKGGVDLFLLETMSNLGEMQLAIEAVRQVSDLPIIAQMTISGSGTTIFGDSSKKIAEVLSAQPVDVIGLNCSIGPKETLEAIEEIRAATSLPVSAQPNAGNPQNFEGRTIYLSTPEYMATFAQRMIMHGVNIVGGCCGTTPDHIRAISNAARSIHLTERQSPAQVVEILEEVTPQYPPTPQEEKSRLARSLNEGRFVVSVEIDPPAGTDFTRAMDAARELHAKGIDAINIADGPRASARMSPMSLATLFEKEIGIESILHYCCRDRNILGMQSDLLGANALGLRNIVIITGDPPKLGDYPDATAVFDVDSIGLTRIASNLNLGFDIAGKPIGKPTSFFTAVGANPGAIDLDVEVERFHRKVDAGAEYVMTQPVYDIELFDRFMERIEPCPIPVLIGILPLASHRNAEFLHNEVPGMQIPDDIRERMAEAGTGPKAREEGIRIAQEALLACMPKVQGAYIMPPFSRHKAALSVLEVLKGNAPGW
jgi:homocysteine S-methyltransferase